MADRLAYLARDGGTEHLVERDGERYRLTEEGKSDILLTAWTVVALKFLYAGGFAVAEVCRLQPGRLTPVSGV